MSQNNLNEFLDQVLSYIKFHLVKDEIKAELESHILDKMDYYTSKGYNKEEAEELAVNDMGDPKQIGIQLNKQHNPLIGWILKITNGLVGFIAIAGIFLSIVFVVPSIIMSLFVRGPIHDITKESIEYRIDLDEQVRIDNRIINFTNLVYEKDGSMNILYNERETGLLRRGGWSFGTIGEISDNLGNEYFNRYGSSTGGSIITNSIMTIDDFSEEAEELIIEYDNFNRHYRVEIPLNAGESHE